ncbi:MAG TPA: DEAD/DEAH box helicase [Pseudomonadota bacterium]|nr:DEAD/DEAH box helicase [Pseudomonadota bacterium]
MPLADTAEHDPPAAAPSPSLASFAALALPEPLLRAVTDKGYEEPTPIQTLAIPLLLKGRDVIGQAQTGTGKTAAFSLPLLARIDPQVQAVQALVLVPTRELALQVATAVHAYAQHLPRVNVLPIFGGDSMDRQITRLGRGTHVVVGTPGRILDHLRRGSLDLSRVGFLVLDEADEMLRMGFLEDVEAILKSTPAERQTTLLSATLPPEIRRVSRHHLRDPEHVAVAAQTVTVDTTEQRVAIVPEALKLEAVVRLLETEEPEAALIFTRTRIGASALAEQLTGRGFPAEALHSDLSQAQRLLVLQRLRDRRAQVVVATDVAARGLDIDHISHVINYDLPGDAETYVHRIGRTGRAGRAGVALLLATPYQRPLLRNIERFTQRPLVLFSLPTYGDVARRRRERVQAALTAAAAQDDLASYRELCAGVAASAGREPLDVAAAALRLLTADRPLFPPAKAHDPLARLSQPERQRPDRNRGPEPRDRGPGQYRSSRPAGEAPYGARQDSPRAPRSGAGQGDVARILLSVGQSHGIRPGDIVGAIANEAGLSGRDIGRVEIHDHDSVVEIPAAALQQVLTSMRNATVRGQAARPRALPGSDAGAERERPHRSFTETRPDPERDRPRSFADSPSSDRDRPPRPRPFADSAQGFDRDRPPRPRPFADSAQSSDRERPQRPRPFADSAQSSDRERPQRPRPFADSGQSFGRDRPQRPRPFAGSAPSFDRGRPPRPRPFADSPPSSDRERPQRPWAQRSESRPDEGAPAYKRPPARSSGAGGWTWGTSAPPYRANPDAPSPSGQGERPPKRRPR